MESEKFSTFDVDRICNISNQCLREWIDRRYIKPSIQKAAGRGSKTLFTRKDLYLIKTFEFLAGSGFSRDGAKIMLGHVKALLDAAPSAWAQDPSFLDHIIFLKHRISIGYLRGIIPINDEDFKKKPLYDLLTHGGYLKDALEYEKLVILNFKKLRKNIDIAIS